MTKPFSLTFGRAALVLGALIAGDLLLPAGPFFGPAPAEAIVGRPLSPVSVAGVARRTTRRAVVATSTVAATTPTTVVVVENPPPPQQQQQPQ